MTAGKLPSRGPFSLSAHHHFLLCAGFGVASPASARGSRGAGRLMPRQVGLRRDVGIAPLRDIAVVLQLPRGRPHRRDQQPEGVERGQARR